MHFLHGFKLRVDVAPPFRRATGIGAEWTVGRGAQSWSAGAGDQAAFIRCNRRSVEDRVVPKGPSTTRASLADWPSLHRLQLRRFFTFIVDCALTPEGIEIARDLG